MKRLHSFLFLIFYFLPTINLIKKGLALKLVIPFLLITFSMFGFQRKKSNPNSDNGLPPATQTGQGIFACKVNGEPWNVIGSLRIMSENYKIKVKVSVYNVSQLRNPSMFISSKVTGVL